MNKLALIPSSKLVPLELQIEFGAIPSGMIPLNNRPAIQYIANSYVGQGFRIAVAVHENSATLEKYIAQHPDLEAFAVDVGATCNLAETILNVLESLQELPEQLVVNYADTLVGDKLPGKNVLFYRKQKDVYRWTTFRIDSGNQLYGFTDKDLEKDADEALPVLVGAFSFDNVKLFKSMLEVALHEHSGGRLDIFYVVVQKYFNRLADSDKAIVEVNDWKDFGHIDTYHDTKKRFGLNQRHFNQVQVDPKRGIVRKSSKDEKLIHEINWYLRLPKKIQYISPRVFNYSVKVDNPFVELEFYGYPALNDIYLFGDCDPGVWEQIFLAIDNLLTELSQYRHKPVDQRIIKRTLREIYVNKTRNRLRETLKDVRFKHFWQGDEIVINDDLCVSLKKTLDLLPGVIEELGIYNISDFGIIHGDLCLSNILYDRRSRIIRVIDPRGIFGDYDIYGDPRYDIAKLLHSLEGNYDFLVNGLFDYRWEGDRFYYSPYIEHRHVVIKEMFRRMLLNPGEGQYYQVKLIESLLFLSMVPLHSDRYESQLCFLARGLETFTSVIKYLNVPMENCSSGQV